MYAIVESAGDYLELCDECGFHGGLVGAIEAAVLLRALPEAWRKVFSHDEELLRTRPEPDVWCAVEYAQHTAAAIEIIEWATRLFATGQSPDWERKPSDHLEGVLEHEVHDCRRFGLDETIDYLAAAAGSLATLTESLTPEELDETADYGDGLILSTRAVIRHALHDAEHHLLDVKRGVARLQLTS